MCHVPNNTSQHLYVTHSTHSVLFVPLEDDLADPVPLLLEFGEFLPVLLVPTAALVWLTDGRDAAIEGSFCKLAECELLLPAELLETEDFCVCLPEDEPRKRSRFLSFRDIRYSKLSNWVQTLICYNNVQYIKKREHRLNEP